MKIFRKRAPTGYTPYVEPTTTPEMGKLGHIKVKTFQEQFKEEKRWNGIHVLGNAFLSLRKSTLCCIDFMSDSD